jgi:hypothetical protein
MGLFGQSFPTDGAKERFAQLHFQAACVRLEMLSRILQAINERGGVEHVPPAMVNEASVAASEVAENLRWAYERLRQTDLQRAEEAARMDFPPGREEPGLRPTAKEEVRRGGERDPRKNANG